MNNRDFEKLVQILRNKLVRSELQDLAKYSNDANVRKASAEVLKQDDARLARMC